MLTFYNNQFSVPLFLIALFFLLSGCVRGADETSNADAFYWVEDASSTLTLNEVLNKDLSTQWSKAPHANYNLGFLDSTVWLSLPFENKNNVATSMLLEIAFPLHDSIEVYLLDGAEIIETFKTGDQVPFAQRPINHRNFLFPHTVQPQEKLRAIVRLKTTDTMYLPVKVWDSIDFFSQDQQEALLLGLFFGLLSIMLVYNLLLYVSTQEKNYLYYSWFATSILYFQLTQKNLGYQYFWPNEVFFNHLSVPISIFLVIGTSGLFIIKFLGLDEKKYPKISSTFRVIIWSSLLGILGTVIVLSARLSIISYTDIILASAAFGIISTSVAMGVLINLSFNGNRTAQILAVAWFSFLSGALVFVVGRMGVPVPMIFAENGMLIGSTFEAALISFALARHIKLEREARMLAQESALSNERKAREAQHLLLKLKEKTTQQLEAEVAERTYKLEAAMKDLTKANMKLDSLSRIDSLTGLSNRRHFDQEFNETWLSCARAKRPMSLLMADIDHFKSINDTYGHLFGDQCLIKVADTLKKCVSRPRDLAARFGGEEFIIMLPNTNEAGASLIAESIRKGIESIRISHEIKMVKFTISIGVATLVASPDTSFIDLNEAADQALYLAKENGRNQAVIFKAAACKNEVSNPSLM